MILLMLVYSVIQKVEANRSREEAASNEIKAKEIEEKYYKLLQESTD